MNGIGSIERYFRIVAFFESLEKKKNVEASKGTAAESERDASAREKERSERAGKERRSK